MNTATLCDSFPAPFPNFSVVTAIRPRRAEPSRELLQVLELVPQQMFLLEADWSALFENQMAREYSGQLGELGANDLLRRIIHPDDFDGLIGVYQNAIATGEPVETEARLRRKDGQYRWFLHHLNPVRDSDDCIARWCGTRIDTHAETQPRETDHKENLALREEIEARSMFEQIVGTAPALEAVLSRLAKVARTDSTVLITGETGTGKELIARAIHKRSGRSHRAFVSVNCAAIPRDLIASELFGHEKGAFTGALQRRLGRFEMAEGGTIFLDEIGELPAETQVALLRVLQEREFQRVGSSQPIRANVRVIVATHRNLPELIETGTFRSDLFYRINVFPIEVPPLRERKEDIRLLVEYFIDRFASKSGKTILRIDKKTMARLESYPWPGNIRELQNVIERSVIVCDGEDFSIDESWLSSQASMSARLPEALVSQEKELIEAALAESNGRVSGPSGAAAKLGIPGSTLDSKIKSLNINKHRFRSK